jgi:deferrochelatase/peroxidase EfeB
MNTQTQTHVVDRDDIQGLLRSGYGHHVEACFLLLRIRDREAARTWLLDAPVTSMAMIERSGGPLPETVLQLALSSEGLHALGVADEVIDGFAEEFVTGMGGNANRARRLGDVGDSAPERWQWGSGQRVPHVLVLLYALPGRLDAWRRTIEQQCLAGFDRLACLETADSLEFEPFGFRDGISQPKLDWERRRPARDETRLGYGNLSCLGEFVLGYPNEYGGYTDRPLLDASGAAQAMLPRAEDAPDKADLGRNGSYLVLRQLAQDVQGFWRFLDGAAGGDPAQRERLAAAMVGRSRQGVPLVVTGAGDVDAPSADLNDFTYQSDPQGLRCPFGAHIRRANPRNADLPAGTRGIVSRLVRTLGFDEEALQQDLVASTRFHRLLRRGRKYGAASLAESLAAPADAPAGLHFITLGANLARQFEFVQNAWIAGTKFDGLTAESDPQLGARVPAPDGTPTDGYSMPQADGPDRRITGLPRFVTVLGGAYFFLPGLRALRYLATAR